LISRHFFGAAGATFGLATDLLNDRIMAALPRFILFMVAGAVLSLAVSTEAADRFIARHEPLIDSSLFATAQSIPEPVWLVFFGVCLGTAAAHIHRRR
jgi:hypothetical protein